MATHSQMDAALKALYDRIPTISDCTGQCWTSCGPIDMSDRERQKIRQRGFSITPLNVSRIMSEAYYCEALTERRCAVYDDRPLVCRLWGTAESLRCPYGCIPDGGWLPDHEAHEMIIESCRIGGHEYAVPDTAQVRAVLNSDFFKNAMQQQHVIGNAGEELRAENSVPPAFRRKVTLWQSGLMRPRQRSISPRSQTLS